METLLLTHTYEPVERISWQRAITLWWLDKVEILEEYEDREVRSTSFQMRMPSVVRCLKMVRPRKRSVRFSRENVYTRDHGACQYCAKKVQRPEATYDHVVPRRLGGETRWENIVIACLDCNRDKGGRTPVQAGMKLRSTPVKPKSLPATLRFTFTETKGLPKSWLSYLRDVQYWHAELESG
jgi:5-methylcytosine-specific restriction endonuclease McrA